MTAAADPREDMDSFALLGLPRRFEIDRAELERRYRDLQLALHPDRHAQAPARERRLGLERAVRVNEAYRTLRDDLSRARELLALLGAEASEREVADPAFLMEVMELRETLADARRASDLAAVEELASSVRVQREAALRELASGFARAGTAPEAAMLEALRSILSRLRYYERFLDEARAIEDEALERAADDGTARGRAG